MKRLLIIILLINQQVVNCQTTTYNYTGAVQTFVVPAFVFQLQIDAAGAEGGRSIGTTAGPHDPGLGGRVQTILSVTPGDIINIYVGQKGLDGIPGGGVAGGWNGGGAASGGFGSYGGGSGGGASDIRLNGTNLTDRVIIAAGAGGSGYNYFSGGDHGGNGGGLVGLDGLSGGGLLDPPGKGGTQTTGGNGGLWTGYLPGSDGVLGDGGAGNTDGAGGGGGGGYYGGGGGSWAGGAGGSSFVLGTITSSTSHTSGFQSGNGYVTITEMSILPIELDKFDAKQVSNDIELTWSTLSETNSNYFEIQRSANGVDNWETIVNEKAMGNSSSFIQYKAWDYSPLIGNNYYRLKQVDINGNYRVFKPLTVYYSRLNSFSVYPNPAQNYIVIEFENETINDIRFYDMKGNDITNNVTKELIAQNSVKVNISNLANGVYVIKTSKDVYRFFKN